MAEKLTDAIIRALVPPAEGNKITYDAELKGFGLRTTAKGAKAFILNYRPRGSNRERRFTIGRYPSWSVASARAEAKRLRVEVDRGHDPLGDIEAEREAPTVSRLCDRFEAEHLSRKRPGTAVDYRCILSVHIRPHFGEHTKVQDVTFGKIDSLHQKITAAGHPYRANRTIAVLSKMFSLAIKWGMRPDNPCKGIERNIEYGRRRYLGADELERFVQALATHHDKQAANIFRLLLLTGARRGEVLAMRWADVDLQKGLWSKPASSTKQKQAHCVPLSEPVRQLLAEIRSPGEFVFPSHGATGHRADVKSNWKTITKAADISGLRIHDLRHSFASQLASDGASLPLIGALLGHSNPQTTQRYSHLFDDPQRVAVERLGAVVAAAGKPSVV